MSKNASNRFSPEVRSRGVRLLLDRSKLSSQPNAKAWKVEGR
jgi:hypothetical protein